MKIDKCLKNKLQAAKRQRIEYAVKGEGVVATLDAVSFEMFRFACKEFYNAPKKQIICVDAAKDSKVTIVQLTYTVHLEISINYTMNLYYTKCILLINGKATMVFIDKHLKHIHQIMSSVTITGMTVDTKTLNELLTAQLLKLIKNRSYLALKTRKPLKTITFASADDDDKPCLKCKRNCRKRAVECATFQQWIRYNCGKLEDFIINKIETDQHYVFNCFMCQMKSKTAT